MRTRRDVPAHVFVVIPETASGLGAVEPCGIDASTSERLTAPDPRWSPGLHRRPSGGVLVESHKAVSSGSSEDELSPRPRQKPVTNVAFVMGTFYSWSGACVGSSRRRSPFIVYARRLRAGLRVC